MSTLLKSVLCSSTAGGRRRRIGVAVIAAGALALGLAALPAAAATTTTTTFSVSTSVQATCSITANSLAFGTYTGAAMASTAVLSVSCTNTTPYDISLNAGVGNGATVSVRQMMGPGAATLGYRMFRDAGYTLNWGNSIGTDTRSGAGSGSAQAINVYGQVSAGQAVTPGAYTDTITATVTY